MFTASEQPHKKSLTAQLLSISQYSLLALILSACTSGSDGNNVGVSSGSSGEDPVALSIPIAYIKRPIPADLATDAPDLSEPTAFNTGAELYVRNQSSSSDEIAVHDKIIAITAAEEGVTIDEIELDIKDLETSIDGTTLIFAARAVPIPVNTNLELTTWNIWTYDFESEQVSYLISDRLQRNEGFANGGGQDIAPIFLNDEKIIFSSTRQVTSQAKQLNEGRAQIYAALTENSQEHATVLHSFDPDSGANTIEQLSFNQNHDIDPIVLENGEILFSRLNRTGNHFSFYKVNPDGAQMSLVYGYHSDDSGTAGTSINFTQARELEDGRIAAIARTFDSPTLGGNLVIIDKDNFVEIDQPIWADQGSSTGTGQSNAINLEVRTDDLRSEGGQFAAVYPMSDDSGRLLISWSPCRVEDASATFIPCNLDPDGNFTTLAPPLFGIWLLDAANNTQQPVIIAEEGVYISEIVAGDIRDYPSLATTVDGSNSDLAAIDKGQLIIDSVYDIDGVDTSAAGISNHAEPGGAAYTTRPARFLRLVKDVPRPDDDVFDIPNYALGRGNNDMREIIGYATIEPDGSVSTTVPANTPFIIEIVDENARRISRQHSHWLQVAPGEILHCTGCHTSNSELPHGRVDSRPASANAGAQPRSDGSLGFFATVADLFGLSTGDTMAEIYDLRRPAGNETQTERQLSLHPVYTDEWTDTNVQTPDAAIDLSYESANWALDPNWASVLAPIVVPNLDPTLDSRIVINYVDHIQTIWSRVRTPVNDAMGNPVDTCIGCHQTANITGLPAGQLDLSAVPSANNPTEQFRSYHELFRQDAKQMLDTGGNLVNRSRTCHTVVIATDIDGNQVCTIDETISTIVTNPTMRTTGANNSLRFLNCFSGSGNCGRNDDANGEPLLADNCSPSISTPGEIDCGPALTLACPDIAGTTLCNELEGTIILPTTGTVDHQGLLSVSELRLISEWLDIGAQYYNNPFDQRLAP